MLKLVKYLKPFTVMILITIGLLYVQAICDLSLPDYMSNIVNKGIQQNGIETAVPKAIRSIQMDRIYIFLNAKDKELVEKSYSYVDKSHPEYSTYLKEYPYLKDKPIYVLKTLTKEEENKLTPVIGKGLITVSGIEKMKSESKGGALEINGKKIPTSMDPFVFFKLFLGNQAVKISDDINKRFESLGSGMINQAAAGSVKNEYVELGIDMEKIQTNYIMSVGLKMLLISLISVVCTIIVGFLSAWIAAGFSKNIRREVFKKVESFSNSEFDKFSTASLITRTTNDITQIQTVIVMFIRIAVYAPMMGIGGIIKAMDKSVSMSWIIALAVIVLLSLITSVFSVALPKFKAIQKLIDKLNLVTRENLTGMMVIRAFNTQKFEENRFDLVNKDLTSANLFVSRLMSVMFPAMMLIMNGTSLLIVWVGAHQIANSSMQVGDMMAFMQYAIQIIFSFLMLSMIFIMMPRASVSAQRVDEVLKTNLSIKDPEKPLVLKSSEGLVEFKNVSFKYEGAEENVLKNITFKAKPGETTAIIGSTGSGKSSLVNLIPRFYDVTEGEISIDGIDIRKVTQYDLRNLIGYVPQTASLFKGNIESNLRYARENASETELLSSAEVAQAIEFINESPEGLKREISQGGTNVSGGQKQRLSIARALIKKPKIFIFDDSFSALDYKTDRALRKALKESTGESTVIIVAQRIATIKNAEQIIVLDEGKIVGTGTHDELIKNCQTYQEIAYSQLSKEELS